jgi:hypothetical protein
LIIITRINFAQYSFDWIYADPDTIYADGGNTYSEISVKVIDEFSLPVENVPVCFQATFGNIIYEINTDENGIGVTTFWDSGESGVSLITAYVDVDTTETHVVILPTNSLNDNIFSPITINNFPNPFNPSTTIEFSIQNDSKIELSIFNIKGQKVKTLINNQMQNGKHSIIWNGDDDNGNSVSSGIYYYKLNLNGKTEEIKKCLLLK